MTTILRLFMPLNFLWLCAASFFSPSWGVALGYAIYASAAAVLMVRYEMRLG